MITACVGFVECPCDRCRQTRRTANLEHPAHRPETDRAYCAGCRQAARIEYVPGVAGEWE